MVSSNIASRTSDPAEYGPLKAITADEVVAFLKDRTGDESGRYRWPGEKDEPSQMIVPQSAGNVLNQGRAVDVTITAYCDDLQLIECNG